MTKFNKDITYFYDELIRHKDFYIKQNHCLEGLWGADFKKTREKEKESFFNAIIQEAIPGEPLKTETYNKLIGIIDNEWGAILRLNVPIKNLSEKDYEEKVDFTLNRIKCFALKEKRKETKEKLKADN